MCSDVSENSCAAAKDDESILNYSCSGSNLMVMVPGLFQTLDTLEKAVLPLLEAHPGLTVLLVAPPGLPNTHWPAAISLDGEVWHSKALFPLPGRGWLRLCGCAFSWCAASLSTSASQSRASSHVSWDKCRFLIGIHRKVVSLNCRMCRVCDQGTCSRVGKLISIRIVSIMHQHSGSLPLETKPHNNA